MEEKLQFIQYQLWAVIFLLVLFVGANLLCYFSNKAKKDNEPPFDEMWFKGEIDELLLKTSELLQKYPNHTSALYFHAKALIAKREGLSKAKEYLLKVLETEPSLRSKIQEELDEIEHLENS